MNSKSSYLYLSWDAWLGSLADLGFFTFSFSFLSFHFLLFLFLSFFDLVSKQGSFTMALGSFRLVVAWRLSKGTRTIALGSSLLRLSSHGHMCHPKLHRHHNKGRYSLSMMWTPHSPHVHATCQPNGSRGYVFLQGVARPLRNVHSLSFLKTRSGRRSHHLPNPSRLVGSLGPWPSLPGPWAGLPCFHLRVALYPQVDKD